MQRIVYNNIDEQIKYHKLELLKLQIEHQRMQNTILKTLFDNNIPVNKEIVKHNINAVQYNSILESLKTKPPPNGMYA